MGKGAVICEGTVKIQRINETHKKIKELVESYKDINLKVSQITNEVQDHWVGAGRNEFQSQYGILIKKIEDFGDTLQEIYEGLVKAEATYEAADDEIRQEYVMAMQD